jgi:transcriptional regulator with XRE-family HTH domain
MITNREEKERRVIELYNQGKTIREIAKEVHMSFGSISEIIKKVNGDDKKTLSIDAQAFQLFLDGKEPIEVAITLDLRANDVEGLYKEFWRLIGLDELSVAYEQIKDHFQDFLKLYTIMKLNKMTQKDIVNALKYANQLPSLENEFQILVNQIRTLKEKKKLSKSELFTLVNEISKTKNSLRYYQSSLKDKNNKIAAMDKKIVQLNAVIERIQNDNEEHQKMEQKE